MVEHWIAVPLLSTANRNVTLPAGLIGERKRTMSEDIYKSIPRVLCAYLKVMHSGNAVDLSNFMRVRNESLQEIREARQADAENKQTIENKEKPLDVLRKDLELDND